MECTTVKKSNYTVTIIGWIKNTGEIFDNHKEVITVFDDQCDNSGNIDVEYKKLCGKYTTKIREFNNTNVIYLIQVDSFTYLGSPYVKQLILEKENTYLPVITPTKF